MQNIFASQSVCKIIPWVMAEEKVWWSAGDTLGWEADCLSWSIDFPNLFSENIFFLTRIGLSLIFENDRWVWRNLIKTKMKKQISPSLIMFPSRSGTPGQKFRPRWGSKLCPRYKSNGATHRPKRGEVVWNKANFSHDWSITFNLIYGSKCDLCQTKHWWYCMPCLFRFDGRAGEKKDLRFAF